MSLLLRLAALALPLAGLAYAWYDAATPSAPPAAAPAPSLTPKP